MVTVQEIANTNRMSLDLDGITATRSFYLHPPSASEQSIVMADAFNLADIPQWGSVHPDIGDIIVQSVSVQREQQSESELYRVDCTYKPAPGTGSPSNVFTGVSSGISATWVDVYRFGATLPASIDTPAQYTDIGGTHVDVAGSPISQMNRTQTFRTSHHVDGVPNMAAFFMFTGRRNSATWQGFVKGHLLYLGCTIDRVNSEHYRVQHDFLFDNSGHLRQSPGSLESTDPKFDQHGRPILDAARTVKTVVWVQPFPDTFNPASIGIPL